MISLAGVTRPLAAARYAVCKTHEHLDTLRPRERAVRSLTSARRQASALPADRADSAPRDRLQAEVVLSRAASSRSRSAVR